MSAEELSRASQQLLEDALQGAQPAPAGRQPLLMLTIGPPGAGKSTVSHACMRQLGAHAPAVIDFDLAYKAHPRYADVWDLRSVDGARTGVGAAMGFIRAEALGEVMESVLGQFFDPDDLSPRGHAA